MLLPGDERNGLSLEDDLHIGRIDALHSTLRERLGAGGEMVLDLSGVTACDTASAQLFVSLGKSARAQGKTLRIVSPSAAFQEILRALGLSLEDLMTPADKSL